MSVKVYIAINCYSDWDSYHEKIGGVFTSREGAEKYVKEQKEKVDKFWNQKFFLDDGNWVNLRLSLQMEDDDQLNEDETRRLDEVIHRGQDLADWNETKIQEHELHGSLFDFIEFRKISTKEALSKQVDGYEYTVK